MMTALKRIVRAGFVGFWRNAFVSLSAIFVMTVALFVIGSTMLVNTMLGVSLNNIQSKVNINVYFVTSASTSDIMSLENAIKALPEVDQVTYTSRDDALAAFRARHQNDETIMQGLDELGVNPLGASLTIRAKETSQYADIASFIQAKQQAENPQSPLIDHVNYLDNKVAIETLTKIIHAVQRASLVAMIVLVASSILITFNTVRLAIYTTREEISVMRLVGASNSFIRGPFMLQGIMYGIAAGVFALLIIYPIVLWLGPVTASFFQFNLFTYFVTHFGYYFGVLVGLGAVLGMVSSVLAVARYLRV